MIGRSYTRQHEQLRRADGARGDHDLGGRCRLQPAADAVLDAGSPPVLDQQSMHQRVADDGEVGPVPHRPQVSVRSGLAVTVDDVEVDRPEALLQAASPSRPIIVVASDSTPHSFPHSPRSGFTAVRPAPADLHRRAWPRFLSCCQSGRDCLATSEPIHGGEPQPSMRFCERDKCMGVLLAD
jgi:hypothetical protein